MNVVLYRLTHATTGLVLTENFSSVVQHNEFHGLRIGAKIVNLLDEEHPNKVVRCYSNFKKVL